MAGAKGKHKFPFGALFIPGLESLVSVYNT